MSVIDKHTKQVKKGDLGVNFNRNVQVGLIEWMTYKKRFGKVKVSAM